MLRQSGSLFLVSVLIGVLVPGPFAQIGNDAVRAALAELDPGRHWNLDSPPPAWLTPEPAGDRTGFELTARGPGPRFYSLGLLELDGRVEVRARLFESDLGRLFVVLGSDPRRNRGLAIDFGDPGPQGIEVFNLRPNGARRIATAPRGRWLVNGGRIAVRLEGDRLHVEFVGLPVFGESGLRLRRPPRAGRIQLAVQGGSIRLEELRVRGRATSDSLRRLRQRAESPPLTLPAAPPLPITDVYSFPPDRFFTNGIAGAQAARHLAWRKAAADGRGLEVLGEIEKSLRDRGGLGRPSPGLEWLAGVIRLVETDDVSALRWHPPGPRPHDLPLVVERRLAQGELDGLEEMIGSIEAPHLGAGLAWQLARARGKPGRLPPLELSEVRCRRCQARCQRARDLEALQRKPWLGAAGDDRLRVRSDLGSQRARRLREMARRFLANRPFGALEVEPMGLEIIAFADPERLEAWNRRFGGGGTHAVAGVYHPGWNLIVILDDVDDTTTRLRLNHELVHHLIASRPGTFLMPVLEEGLCELLARGARLGDRAARYDRTADAEHLAAAFSMRLRGRLDDAEAMLWRDPWTTAHSLDPDAYSGAWFVLRCIRKFDPGAWSRHWEDGGFLGDPNRWDVPSKHRLQHWLDRLEERPLGRGVR